MTRLAIIGSGNVAWALAEAAALNDALELVQIYARDKAGGGRLAQACGCDFASSPEGLETADVYIVAVSDAAIGPVSAQLDFGHGVVLHTAGSVPADALSEKIAHRGVLYPLQTFSKGRRADLSVVPLLVEGCTPYALECAERVASALSGRVARMGSAQRVQIHLAAVFACNFVNHMYAAAETLASRAGLPFDMLGPLIVETAAKACAARSPRDVQTGPASRGDVATVRRHAEMLSDDPAMQEIYVKLSDNIWEPSKKI